MLKTKRSLLSPVRLFRQKYSPYASKSLEFIGRQVSSKRPSPNCTAFRVFSSSKESSKPRPDPFARRPNKKCDPYGQEGKPLSSGDAQRLLGTVHPHWRLMSNTEGTSSDNNDEGDDILGEPPSRLTRSFEHPDFLSASSFLNHVAAVAQMSDHFPSLRLQRELDSRWKVWKVISTISCHTFVLQGLSHHDFFLATLIDVEMERPEVRSLLVQSDDGV